MKIGVVKNMPGKRVLRLPSGARLSCSFEVPDAAEWRALTRQASATSAFRVPGWIETWANSYLPKGRWRGPYRPLSVRNERGELVAVLPLARMKFGPIEFRAAVGPYLPHRGLVLTSRADVAADACAAAANSLINYVPWRLGLRMGPISDQDTAIATFVAALRHRGWSVVTRRLGNCMVIGLPADMAEFNERLGGIIKRANYYERRMRRIGEVRIAEARASEDERWPSVVDDAAAIEKNSWIPRENGDLLLSGSGDRMFWRQAATDEFLRSALALWIVYFNEVPVSFSLTLDAGKTKFILANLYDERIKTYSVGSILTFHVISRAIDQRFQQIDWGLGDSGYKKRWLAKPGYGLYDLIAFPPGPMGWALQGILRKGFGFHTQFDAPAIIAGPLAR